MHVICPGCSDSIDLPETATLTGLVCPSCGSDVRPPSGSTTGWIAPEVERLGRFRLLAVAGQGAFGAVYRAEDTELGRVVAVKVPRAGTLTDQKERDRFLREARSAARLRHPHIVPVHEVGEWQGRPFLVSDFVEGVTLADRLSGGRPPVREAVALCAALADALHYAHERGVVHRDVKPSNVLLGEGDSPHLTDFGLARQDDGDATVTADGQVLGTPAYMSPEQARGAGHAIDGRADVYSLGVVLYQMLTGRLPFRGNSRLLLHQVLHDEPAAPRKIDPVIPRDLETVCLKAMAKEPGRRYTTAAEFAADLRRFLDHQPVWARRAGVLERVRLWARRRPGHAALVGIGVGLVALAVAAGLYWHQRERNFAGLREREEERLRQEAAAGEVRVEYFANVTRRWGAPEGVGRLTPDQVRGRDASFKLHSRGGKVEVVEAVNSRGRPARHDASAMYVGQLDLLSGSGQPAVRYEYQRDDQGRIAREVAYDRYGSVAWRLVYSTPTTAQYFDHRGRPLTRVKTGAGNLEFGWGEDGLPREVWFLDRDGNRRPDAEGVYGLRQEFNAQGRPTRKTYLDRDGRPMLCKRLCAVDLFTYDELGNYVEWGVYGPAGEPLRDNTDGIHFATRRYDANGNVVECFHYGVDRQPCFNDGGIHRIVIRYNDHGDLLESRYYGPDGRPAAGASGHAGVRRRHDDRGNVVETTFLGVDGQPTASRNGIATIVMSYDANDLLTSHQYFDTQGRPALNTNGVHQLVWRLDERGNAVEQAYFGRDGRPVVPRDNYARLTRKFSERDEVLEVASFGADGKPTLDAQGVHKVVYAYDARGNQTRQRLFGTDGAPKALPSGVWETRWEYDENGHETARSFFDVNGQPAVAEGGMARVRSVRDDHGRVLEVSYFGARGEGVLNSEKIHRGVNRYDERGNEVSRAYFDVAGKPTPIYGDSYVAYTMTYGSRRELLEIQYLGKDDKPVDTRTPGYSREVRTYDRFNRLIDKQFYDAAGKPVATRLVVTSVNPSSEAGPVGLLKGDVIVSFSGREVRHMADYSRALDAAGREGKPKVLTVLRQGKRLPIVLPAWPRGFSVEDRAAAE